MTQNELDMIPARTEAERLYSSSVVKQWQGDVEGSTQDYLRAQELQARLPSARPPSEGHNSDGPGNFTLFEGLNEDLLVVSLRFLIPADILSLSLVSKRCRMISSNSLLWRELFLLRWPTLLPAESSLPSSAREGHSPNDDGAIPLAIHEPRNNRYGRHRYLGKSKKYHNVYVAVLSRKPQLRKDNSRLDGMYDGPPTPKPNYMFSNLLMAQFDIKEREPLKWHQLRAVVNGGAIQFAGSPLQHLTIPVLADTELLFATGDATDEVKMWSKIDTCILEIPQKYHQHDAKASSSNKNQTKKQYLAICTQDPLKTVKRSFSYGILADLSRLLIARQTEQALRYQNSPSIQTVAVRCDAKTKQWLKAYSRRHLAERFFDVVTFDIGSRFAKFTSSRCTLETLLKNKYWKHGACAHYRDATLEFFKEAARRYRPHDDFPFAATRIEDIMDTGLVRELIDASKDDPDLVLPRPILEANKGCGSIPSLIAQSRGHLWSAKHGLNNHLVGDQCIEMSEVQGVYTTSLMSPPKADLAAMSVIIAYLVEDSFIRRPTRRISYYYDRVTCAEHPINIVEPVLGFSEVERIELIRYLSEWNVPFVGFVNGAVAALMCGTDPKRNGIVAMLGGINSGVALVKDGVFLQGIHLKEYNRRMLVVKHQDEQKEAYLEKMDDEIAEEVSSAITALLEISNDDSIGIETSVFVLLTGGGATDSIVTSVKNCISTTIEVNIEVASVQEERHLDAVRGGHVMASISNKWRHFRGVMNHMWAMHVDE